MITSSQISASAKRIGCNVAAIKAVIEVESGGSGFLADGTTPKILFEPHIFWKQLRIRQINPYDLIKRKPELKDILYPSWGQKPYGKVSEQHSRLARAVSIDRDAALMSASWGLFQIMGFNWIRCGVKSFQEFINAMYTSEDRHLDLFDDYICNTMLDDELRAKDWAGFARGYNGASYAKNRYDTKLAAAYKKHSS